MLLVVFESNVRPRQRAGILAGVACNGMLGFWAHKGDPERRVGAAAGGGAKPGGASGATSAAAMGGGGGDAATAAAAAAAAADGTGGGILSDADLLQFP